MSFLKFRLLPAFMIVGLVASASEATDYHLYYLGGQSNMDGYGRIEELPPELAAPVPGVMIFHGNTSADGTPVDGRGLWAELQPGHGAGYMSDGTTVTYSQRFGVELSFARTLVELDPTAHIAIIKYSRGGSSIDRAAASHFGCWDPDYPGVNQYDHFLATVRNASSFDDIDGDGKSDRLTPMGIIWMQGESDAAHTEAIALRYEDHLKRLMDLIRAAFRTDDLPVVIGRISDSGQDMREKDGKVWNYGDVVRRAQQSFVSNDSAAALVSSTDGYAYSDPWHYDSAAYLDLGRRFAIAVDGLRHKPSSSTPDPDPIRFEREIDAFAIQDGEEGPASNPILFAGSSSIVGWPTKQSFPDCPVVNRGFGGAHISDINHYYPVVVKRYRPRVIVFYAGDNDIAAGKSPDEVFQDFEEFVANVRRDMPGTEILYLPIKPSALRWQLWGTMNEVNARVESYAGTVGDIVYVDTARPMLGDDGTPNRELLVDDGLHLSAQGYELWSSILRPYLAMFCTN